MKLHLFLVLKINGVKKIARGGWPGFGMVTVGMDPNTFEVLNGHPNKIPTDKILGGVVQNCHFGKHYCDSTDKVLFAKRLIDGQNQPFRVHSSKTNATIIT